MKELEKIVELITGNVAEEQKNNILNQVKGDAQLLNEFNLIKNAWALSSSRNKLPELKIERSYLALQSRIKDQNRLLSISLYTWFKYAAILVIIFGAGIFSGKYMTGKVSERKTAKNELTEFVVPSGQMAEVNLPDGSHVWLNSESRLSFTDNFRDKTRNVTLKGEALFKVRKGEKPFVVSTRFGEVRVKGTTFNICAYENSAFQTTLVEGSVTYKNTELNKEVLLSPGQQITLSENEGIQVHEVKTELYTLWKDGLIIFEKEPMREVMRKLERHFAIRINLEDNLLSDIRFTGKIENESLIEVMEYINKTKPIGYSYDKKQKILTIKLKQKK
jgi:ferric-dicitrate binding protein FerR (iron transport regulator)